MEYYLTVYRHVFSFFGETLAKNVDLGIGGPGIRSGMRVIGMKKKPGILAGWPGWKYGIRWSGIGGPGWRSGIRGPEM